MASSQHYHLLTPEGGTGGTVQQAPLGVHMQSNPVLPLPPKGVMGTGGSEPYFGGYEGSTDSSNG